MCGIAAVFLGSGAVALPDWPFHRSPAELLPTAQVELPRPTALRKALNRRGPDSSASISFSVAAPYLCETDHATLELIATTLSLRDVSVPPHPRLVRYGKDHGYLLYNGEIYDVNSTVDIPCGSDTAVLCDIVAPLVAYHENRVETDKAAMSVLANLDALRGPFSLMLWTPASRRLYFAKDMLGRRSLLVASVPGSGLCITSTAPKGFHSLFAEVPPMGMCFVEVGENGQFSFGCIPRGTAALIHSEVSCISCFKPLSCITCDELSLPVGASAESLSFLGTTMLRCTCPEQVVKVSDRSAGSADQDTRIPNPMTTLMQDDAVDSFLNIFERALQRRLVLASPCLSCEIVHGRHVIASLVADFAVLFSGGIDSMLLAVLLNKLLPQGQPLDLINVAFGNGDKEIALCPDRITAISGYEELKSVCAGKRIVRLICVDVSPDEADDILEHNVRHLLHPCSLAMDSSIGTALWVAARGRGFIHRENESIGKDGLPVPGLSQSDVNQNICHLDAQHGCECSKSSGTASCESCCLEVSEITSSARILFSGLGADEIMGGYKGRHRNCFGFGGSEALSRAINSDVSRLWFRNLGRDDRLVSDHGREIRHPFLDEDLIRFVANLPLVECVCDLSRPDGIGDKQLLRRAAAKIGLSLSTSHRKKRAMQFGSRSKHVLERRK